MPLYQLIFLEECKCLSEGTLDSIREFGSLVHPQIGALFSKEIVSILHYNVSSLLREEFTFFKEN